MINLTNFLFTIIAGGIVALIAYIIIQFCFSLIDKYKIGK